MNKYTVTEKTKSRKASKKAKKQVNWVRWAKVTGLFLLIATTIGLALYTSVNVGVVGVILKTLLWALLMV